MVLMLRHHPSLLFWNCGNELFPVNQQAAVNPTQPAGDPQTQVTLLRRLKDVIAATDPGRFYITSSMSNYTNFDSSYALAPKDGNYGINAPETYFSRNPGLTYPNHSRMDCPISFQPEIGSTSSPVVESLRRFLRPGSLNDYPTSAKPNATLNPAWVWHNYEDFTTPDGINRLERLGVPATIEEYAMNAQLAQLFQYQALYEGFQVSKPRFCQHYTK